MTLNMVSLIVTAVSRRSEINKVAKSGVAEGGREKAKNSSGIEKAA